MAKTIRFLRSSLPAILIAFLLAIGGVVLTLNIPKVLGNATDEIMVGLMTEAYTTPLRKFAKPVASPATTSLWPTF